MVEEGVSWDEQRSCFCIEWSVIVVFVSIKLFQPQAMDFHVLPEIDGHTTDSCTISPAPPLLFGESMLK